jgi:hypothetical protein
MFSAELPPGGYRAKMPASPNLDRILEAALCPYSLLMIILTTSLRRERAD